MKRLLWVPILFGVIACNFAVISGLPTSTPEILPTFTFTAEPTATVPGNGTIAGKLSYPSDFMPPMRVVAFSLTDGKAYFVDTAERQHEYSLTVPAGTYYVVVYAHTGNPGTTGQVDSYAREGGSFAGGYTEMVPCGLSADCTDHTLLPVTVSAGENATADPGDWYAPEGTFPPVPEP